MNRIQAQANKLWQLLSTPDTLATYRKTVLLTWEITKETAGLLWLVICLGLVFFDWSWKWSIQAGRSVRGWVNNIDGSKPDQLAGEVGKALISAGKNSVDYTLTQAREQLGLPLTEVEPKPELVAVSTPTPEPVKVSAIATPPEISLPTEVDKEV